MSIFKRKSKATKAEKEDKQPAADDKPKPAPYKHVPTHAAADAVKKVPSQQQGTSGVAREYAMGNAAHSQFVAHNAMHTTPSPSSLAGQQRQLNGRSPMQSNNSAEVFTTDPDAPPMPTPVTQQPGNATPRSGMSRDSSAYFAHTKVQPPSFDSPILGNPKMQLAARDRGYVDPHHSADSGYGSVAHSRTPSESINPTEVGGTHLPRNNSGFLPEMSLSEELAREPAFSEQSFSDEPLEALPSPKKAPESVLKGGRDYFSRDDSRSVKSTKSVKTPKQARFEQAPEAVLPKAQDQQEQRTEQYSHTFLAEALQIGRPEPTSLPQPQFGLPARSSTPPLNFYGQPRPSFTAPVRHSTPPPPTGSEPRPQYALPARMSTPPPARERAGEHQMSFPARSSSPAPRSGFAPLERIVSPVHQSTVPVSRLEGFKVNKRGKILDEEGEPIGELSEGDIMDCVRQRVNAYGEVLDDYGSVVGRVRTLQRAHESPILRMSSPVPDPQQQQQYMPQYQQPRPMSPAFSLNGREQATTQPEAFTPAWQQQSHAGHSMMVEELRDHMAAAPDHTSQGPVTPLDFPGDVPAVELPAIESEHEQDDDMLPIFDHSDVFMPPPSLPVRSPHRRKTPSPPPEKQQQRPMSEQPQPARMSQDMPRTQSRHVSAPPPPRSLEPATRWAASALIAKAEEPEEPFIGPLPLPSAQPQSKTQLKPQPQEQQQTARPTATPLIRSASDSSLSELGKSYSRPSMSPVPEDSAVPNEESSPAMFSYKGDIPVSDGPGPNANLAPPRAIGAKSPPPSNFTRQPSNSGLAVPGGTSWAPMNSAPYSQPGSTGPRAGLGPRQFSTGVPGPRPMVNTRHSSNMPLKRSPLSSHGKAFLHSILLAYALT